MAESASPVDERSRGELIDWMTLLRVNDPVEPDKKSLFSEIRRFDIFDEGSGAYEI